MPPRKRQSPESKIGTPESEVGAHKSLINSLQSALFLAPTAGAILALAIGGILIQLNGINPFKAYQVMIVGAFGGSRQLSETILKATPLLIIGLGLTIAFRSKVWNIGAEGQYYFGALFGSIVALTFPEWPAWLLIPLMLVAGAIGGMLWSGLAGLLYIKRGTNIIICTLMLNYIAVLLVQFAARVPLRDPNGFLPESAQFSVAAQIPTLFGGRLHLGVLLALILVGVVYVLLWRTPLGFHLRAVGSSAIEPLPELEVRGFRLGVGYSFSPGTFRNGYLAALS